MGNPLRQPYGAATSPMGRGKAVPVWKMYYWNGTWHGQYDHLFKPVEVAADEA